MSGRTGRGGLGLCLSDPQRECLSQTLLTPPRTLTLCPETFPLRSVFIVPADAWSSQVQGCSGFVRFQAGWGSLKLQGELSVSAQDCLRLRVGAGQARPPQNLLPRFFFFDCNRRSEAATAEASGFWGFAGGWFPGREVCRSAVPSQPCLRPRAQTTLELHTAALNPSFA